MTGGSLPGVARAGGATGGGAGRRQENGRRALPAAPQLSSGPRAPGRILEVDVVRVRVTVFGRGAVSAPRAEAPGRGTRPNGQGS